jgi:leucyl aminopeptidase
MTDLPKITFAKTEKPKKGVAVLLAGDGGKLGPRGRELDKAAGGAITRAIKSTKFKGNFKTSMDLIAPNGVSVDRILLAGTGDPTGLDMADWMALGGFCAGKLGAVAEATLVAELPDGKDVDAVALAHVALGVKLSSYRFDKYKTKKKDEENNSGGPRKLAISAANQAAARKAFLPLDAAGAGALLARDLVNEPANFLGPLEFAERARELTRLGVDVKILDERAMRRLKMGALLAVSQGSAREGRLVVMRWNGGKARAKPVAFVGKGVVFDTGGISIKPGASMEDMKGDMAGAATVVGLMHALAARKAKANVVGVIGLVENMPDGKAYRPGDIITSMSGQTIEVINTDAEGRLVLADALTYAQREFKPGFVINLATLTGAIIIALGHQHAGLFSNDDELAARLHAAGEATGEKVWRLPLAKEYDKLIDSKFADMKNTGGRGAGSITAAQFLKRFIQDTPWAHLDIAGTGMSSPQTDINKSWASGFGVRLLDRLVADHYEK